ncbi:ATP-binding protein [Winogradskyella sp.]|uniref:tetratricopeptide repeat-containing sensor histidine kinase n=1 Tax=Winogradskyella sp. TaxID=1883156 RepID=UPI003BAD32C6
MKWKYYIFIGLLSVFQGHAQPEIIDEQVLQNIPTDTDAFTLEEKFKMYFKGLSQLDKASDSVKLKFYHHYSWTLTYEGIHEEAISLCHKAIKLSKETGINHKLFHYYSRLAMNYPRLNKQDSATWAYKKACELRRLDMAPPLYDLPAVNNLGYHYYLHLKQYDSALYYLNMRLNYPKEIISKTHLYYSMSDNIALVYMAQGKYAEARDLFKENFAYYGGPKARRKDEERFIRAGLQWADSEMHLGNLNLAGALITDIKAIFDTISYYDFKYKSKLLLLQTQIDYARRINDYKQVDQLKNSYYEFRDSLNNAESTKKQNDLTLLKQVGLQNAAYDLQQEQRINSVERENLELSLKNESVRIYWILSLGILVSIIIFIFYSLRRARVYSKKKQKLLERFSQDLISEQEKERTRLAMELHDGIGQKLMLLTRKTKDSNNGYMQVLAQDTMEELRTISRGLRPAVLDRLGLKKALDALIEDIDDNSNILFTSNIADVGHAISKDVAIHIYRIIQECLNNILKHSGANSASVTVEMNTSRILTKITDNGKGFNVSQALRSNTSLGMKTIKERAKIIKSQFKILSGNNTKGTTIIITTPIYDN